MAQSLDDDRRPQIVMLRSALADHPLHQAMSLLVQGLPEGGALIVTPGATVVADSASAAEPARSAPGQRTRAAQAQQTKIQDLLIAIRFAPYVVIQEPTAALTIEHVAAATAVRAFDVPVLLVRHPDSGGNSPLARLLDVPPSQILTTPAQRTDAGGWRAFNDDAAEWSAVITRRFDRASRRRFFDNVTEPLFRAARTLDRAAPSEPIAHAIAEIFQNHVESIDIQDRTDFLEVSFPASLYTALLNELATNFTVTAIADPVTEDLPWDDPAGANTLASVNNRIFVIEREYAQKFGIEGVLRQLAAALETSPAGSVSVAPIDRTQRTTLEQASRAGLRLAGMNRFFADPNLVGGYRDERGRTVRLLAFHDEQHAAFLQERALLSSLDTEVVPQDLVIGSDLTKLASWTYSKILKRTTIDAIYDNRTEEYAATYDRIIVAVTPGYYTHLDQLATEVKHALTSLYSTSGDLNPARLRLLELGFGTGALTGRLVRACSSFNTSVVGDKSETKLVQFDGWDANPWMVDIAKRRLEGAATSIQPRLRAAAFEVDMDPLPANERYDIVVASLFSHYWTDVNPRLTGPATHLNILRDFLTAIRTKLLTPRGMALFLDAFYTPSNRAAEQEIWRAYVQGEVGENDAGLYMKSNPSQYYAPNIDVVETVAQEAGYRMTSRDSPLGFPFKIMVLTVEGNDGTNHGAGGTGSGPAATRRT